MEYSIGELIYYVDGGRDEICVVLNKAMGYAWSCLDGEIGLPSRACPEIIWFYHIKPTDNPNRFYESTNKCSYEYLKPYDIIRHSKSITKHTLV